MKILLGHTFPEKSVFGKRWIEEWIERLRLGGFNIYPFSLVINNEKPVMYFDELDIRWKLKDPSLMNMYNELIKELEQYDVFICYNGANIHPEFVKILPTLNVYGCFDDPESSDKLSKPVAPFFDLAMVGNIAELENYKNWGCKHVYWWPLGFRIDDYDSALSEDDIIMKNRKIDVTLLCERETNYRKEKVDKFSSFFPQGVYHGKGWTKGFLPEEERVPTLQNTKIGINIHNSTGPINFRTFYLPANGVMQICDNKSNLGKIFELGKEVIGYDSIEEAIELTKYFLQHEDERKKIALAGWKRALDDYNEIASFQKVVEAINNIKEILPLKKEDNKRLFMKNQNCKERFFLMIYNIYCEKVRVIKKILKNKYIELIVWLEILGHMRFKRI